MDKKSDVEAHISVATHKGGHILDLVSSRESSSIILGAPSICQTCPNCNKCKSFDDHSAVHFVVNMNKTFAYKERSHTENIVANFMENLHSSQHLGNCEDTFDEMVEAYYEGVQLIINHHAPLGKKDRILINILLLQEKMCFYFTKIEECVKRSKETLNVN